VWRNLEREREMIVTSQGRPVDPTARAIETVTSVQRESMTRGADASDASDATIAIAAVRLHRRHRGSPMTPMAWLQLGHTGRRACGERRVGVVRS
jgi:hypothetical protein